MAGSDIKSVFVQATTSATSNTSVAAAATPSGDFTLTAAVVTFNAARIVTATTTGTNNGGKVITITGTNLIGTTLTDTITLTSVAGTFSSAKYFKTVSGASVSSQPASNVSLGQGAGAANLVFAERARLKGAYLLNSSTAGVVTFRNGSPEGAIKMQIGTVSDAANGRDIVVPDEGVLFPEGAYLTYTGGSGAVFTNITLFHA